MEKVPDRRCTIWFEDGVYAGLNEVDRRFARGILLRAAHPYGAVIQGRGTVIDVNGARNLTLEGFQFQHSGPSGSAALVYISARNGTSADHITFRNNIFHDSQGDDLLKMLERAHHIVVRGNVFYNQGNDEQHIDVNSVTNVRIRNNIFFNAFELSGRTETKTTKHYIVVKDSDGNQDGLLGSSHVIIDGNVMLNWEGGLESFVGIGNDGKSYYEARNILIQNNLIIGNSIAPMYASLSVSGAEDVDVLNNTVVGDLPSDAYAFHVDIKGSNPKNRNIRFSNNVWCDPTGTMSELSSGDSPSTIGLTLDRNLYWNAGKAIPDGSLVDVTDDSGRIIRDPGLEPDQSGVVVPYWMGSDFLGGRISIRAEFVSLVQTYGSIPPDSPAVGRAIRSLAPADDILGHQRDAHPDLGAFEAPR